MESKIGNEIVSTSICADPSRGDGSMTYGGYLMSELNALGKENECTEYNSYEVRLISYSEYYNMSPYYESEDNNYPNVENIKSKINDAGLWLYCNSIDCGDLNGYWWTMSASSYARSRSFKDSFVVTFNGNLDYGYGEFVLGVRPVITVVK